MERFTFFVFDRKYPFWINLIQKTKMISLSSDLVPKLIHKYTKANGGVDFFWFRREIPFLGKFGSKIKNC